MTGLNADEKIWKGRPTFIAKLPFFFSGLVLLGIAPFFVDDYLGLMGAFLFTVVFFPCWLVLSFVFVCSGRYEIGPQKVTVTYGIFRKKTVVVERSQILAVRSKQSSWGRVLGYGDVLLDLRGASGVTVTLKSVRQPTAVPL
ncbi:MAG: PH domain-containing protein [Candidatus Omnitrophica bacterium]|nr:PH domain-containing protein [Candidatus Omnitrophota bacterium]